MKIKNLMYINLNNVAKILNRVLEYLDELFPNPKCELNYNKDYELVIATVLSAQCTDKRVNEVTVDLFKKYPIVIISGDDTKETIEKAFTYDIVDMLNKPFSSDKIKSVVSRMISFKN